MTLWNNFVTLFAEAAPWLLLGYLLAAIIKYCIPSQWMARHLGDQRFSTTIKAAFIGAPLPLCSCGVLPAALGLRRGGASKSATTAFLISTPETGVDSIAISYALLGPILAIVRPIAAVCSAIVAGGLVGLLPQPKKVSFHSMSVASSPFKVGTIPAGIKPFERAHEGGSDCCDEGCGCKDECGCDDGCGHEHSDTPLQPLWRRIMTFAFSTMVSETYRWLVVGLVLAAVIQTYLPESWLAQWGSGFWAMIIMALIGIPMYICATGSTPLAAGFLIAGISPGAVLVFLLAGPATNIATLALVRKELGGRVLACYLTGVVGSALLFGFAIDYLIAVNHWAVRSFVDASSTFGTDSLSLVLSLCLALMMGNALIKEGKNWWRQRTHQI